MLYDIAILRRWQRLVKIFSGAATLFDHVNMSVACYTHRPAHHPAHCPAHHPAHRSAHRAINSHRVNLSKVRILFLLFHGIEILYYLSDYV